VTLLRCAACAWMAPPPEYAVPRLVDALDATAIRDLARDWKRRASGDA
jgi:hypothetical protein